MPTLKSYFFVTNMNCAGCAARVDTVVRAAAGVVSCVVDLARRRVDFEYVPADVTPALLRRQLGGSGFKTSEVPPLDQPLRRGGVRRTIAERVKRMVGVAVFLFCNQLPAAKPYVRNLGLRSRKEWFENKVANVQTPEGRTLKFTGMGNNFLTFQLFWRGTGYYEPITTMVLHELLRTGGTFVDVGANVGFFSLVLSSNISDLEVIAFEPNPKNFRLLERNAQANGFTKILCEPLAVSRTVGLALLHIADSDMSASLRDDFSYSEIPPIEVPTVTLDSYFAPRVCPANLVLKVDVEGAEGAFFDGAHTTLSTTKPDIVIEVAVSEANHPAEFLRGLGYRFYSITDDGLTAVAALQPTIRGNLFFLNYLLSAKPPAEIEELSRRIKGRARHINLAQTSKVVDADQIARALQGAGGYGPGDSPSALNSVLQASFARKPDERET